MARKVTGGLTGSPSVGALNVAPTAVVTAATDQNITLSPQGTGSVVITNNAILNAQSDLRFGDADSSNWVAFQSPATVSANVTWTLPGTDGTNNQVLTTDASGTLSWTSKSVVISDEVSSASTYYPLITTTTTGNATAANVSTTKMTFQPSTGLLAVEGTVRRLVEEVVQTTNYIFALADRSKVVAMNNGAAATVTIPADATVNFAVGTEIALTRIAAGSVTLAAAGGVTVNAGGTGNLALGETVVLRKRAANNWFVNQRPYSVTGTGGSLASVGPVNVHSYTSGASTFVVGT